MAGIPDIKGNVLLPLYHAMAKTDISIVIDANGKFCRATADTLSICVPCTENSAGRGGVEIEPHPLHDQIGYLVNDNEKRAVYLARIEAWSGCHPKVRAVYEYVKGGTMADDLERSGQKISDAELKLFVRFSVQADDLCHNLWEDTSVAKAWENYCTGSHVKGNLLCYVSGKYATPAVKHPRGINMSTYGAKLISCNDMTNYTFRGRFIEPAQANTISMEASQKAHAMLKYLIASHGYKCDTQAVVAWAIDNGDAQLAPFAGTDQFADIYSAVKKIESDTGIESQSKLYTDYAKDLRTALAGMGNAKILSPKSDSRRVAVMAMDAATTGRMGITFYQDLLQNDYVERVLTWHESCNWWFYNGKHDYISAPSADRIIAAVYGEPKGDGYKKIQKQARERLLHHIVCGQPLDLSWIMAAVNNVSRPMAFEKQSGTWEKGIWKDNGSWEKALSVTCALVRKYYSQKKEGFSLELDKTCTDRGYLFGRLLAIADKLEGHARYLQEGKTSHTDRPTNAVRYMTTFSSKPLRTWALIFNQLNPYIQRLNGAEWYQQQIDEIMSLFKPNELDDRPLDGRYLLGYSLQRRALTKNREDTNK